MPWQVRIELNEKDLLLLVTENGAPLAPVQIHANIRKAIGESHAVYRGDPWYPPQRGKTCALLYQGAPSEAGAHPCESGLLVFPLRRGVCFGPAACGHLRALEGACAAWSTAFHAGVRKESQLTIRSGDGMCLCTPSSSESGLKMQVCDQSRHGHIWLYDEELHQIKRADGKCLSVNNSDQSAGLVACDSEDTGQVWMYDDDMRQLRCFLTRSHHSGSAD